jgi:fatty-acyl-CoA synthase
VVYGVSLPGTEGRAGMAAITVAAEFDIAELHRHLAVRLPEYERPLFVRIQNEIAATATFKPIKQELARQGYDPAGSEDSVYINDRSRDAFVKLDAALYDRIRTGAMRL